MDQAEVTGQASPPRPYRLGNYIAAWAVHIFTLTGVVWASLAFLSIHHGEIHYMWLWLGIALIVDGLDGTFARKAQVSKVVSWFDGVILDSVVDYLTWTFLPAIFMYKYIALGPQWLAFSLMVLILTSAMFCYCNKQMKSNDYYFVGFPAAWNIVAFYFWVLQMPAWFNIFATIVLVIMTLVPTAYMHPFRVKRLMTVNIIATVAWLTAAIGFVVSDPVRHTWQWVAFAAGSGWYVGIGVWRTLHGEDRFHLPSRKHKAASEAGATASCESSAT